MSIYGVSNKVKPLIVSNFREFSYTKLVLFCGALYSINGGFSNTWNGNGNTMSLLPDALQSGPVAATHLTPNRKKSSESFEMPMLIGCTIAAWDAPQFTTANNAKHMRPQDYVVGLQHKGVTRAYPMWITDHYHAINDTIAGDPVLFTTCERCQSGAAYESKISGKKTLFSGMGMYNAALTLRNRSRAFSGETSSWLHYEGVALTGVHKDTFLPQIPCFHMTWSEWLESYPDTEVMLPPKDPRHPDARHGHGREEYFSRPGLDGALLQTISTPLDNSYEENEMVLGLNLDGGVKAYPLEEVKKSGYVVHDHIAEYPIVVFAGPALDQCTMAAYSATTACGKTLEFDLGDRCFVDKETNSKWTIDGKCFEGSQAGLELIPLRQHFVRWHAWYYGHIQTSLYRSPGRPTNYPAVPVNMDISAFVDILDFLKSKGTLDILGQITNLRLPAEVSQGIRVTINGNPLNIYLFDRCLAAKDYEALEGAKFCPPFNYKLEKRLSWAFGRFVVESDPIVQFTDSTKATPLPDSNILWYQGLAKQDQDQWLQQYREVDSEGISLIVILKALTKSGYDICEVGLLPQSQLRPGSYNGIGLTINAERFLIYLCDSPDDALSIKDETARANVLIAVVDRSSFHRCGLPSRTDQSIGKIPPMHCIALS